MSRFGDNPGSYESSGTEGKACSNNGNSTMTETEDADSLILVCGLYQSDDELNARRRRTAEATPI